MQLELKYLIFNYKKPRAIDLLRNSSCTNANSSPPIQWVMRALENIRAMKIAMANWFLVCFEFDDEDMATAKRDKLIDSNLRSFFFEAERANRMHINIISNEVDIDFCHIYQLFRMTNANNKTDYLLAKHIVCTSTIWRALIAIWRALIDICAVALSIPIKIHGKAINNTCRLSTNRPIMRRDKTMHNCL